MAVVEIAAIYHGKTPWTVEDRFEVRVVGEEEEQQIVSRWELVDLPPYVQPGETYKLANSPQEQQLATGTGS